MLNESKSVYPLFRVRQSVLNNSVIQKQKQYQWPHSNTCETMNHSFLMRLFWMKRRRKIRADGTNSNFPVLHKMDLSFKSISNLPNAVNGMCHKICLKVRRAHTVCRACNNKHMRFPVFLCDFNPFDVTNKALKIGVFNFNDSLKPVFNILPHAFIRLFIFTSVLLKCVNVTNMSKLCNWIYWISEICFDNYFLLVISFRPRFCWDSNIFSNSFVFIVCTWCEWQIGVESFFNARHLALLDGEVAFTWNYWMKNGESH